VLVLELFLNMLTLSAIVVNFMSRRQSSSLATTASRAISTKIDEDMESKNGNMPDVLFVLGGPGAGKGTQCFNLVKDFGYEHLSAGDLLRAERNSGSKDGALISDYIKEGKIVPVEITISLLDRAMKDSPKDKFLIDGFPRNKNNLDGWDNMMTGNVNVLGVLFFDCPEEVCIQRILKRSETSGRTDDNVESLRKRFRTYYSETMPIIEVFEKKGLVMNVDATPTSEEVYATVKKLLEH